MSLNPFSAFGSRLKKAFSVLSIYKYYLNAHLTESWWLHTLYANP